jgi:hypothetical protein
LHSDNPSKGVGADRCVRPPSLSPKKGDRVVSNTPREDIENLVTHRDALAEVLHLSD